MQKLLSLTRRGINDYRMIENGDKIAVGVSGGKDSMALLAVMKAYQRFSPQSFDLTAIHIDAGLGSDPKELEHLQQYCRSIDVPLTIVNTDIGKIVFEERKESNPCSLCSKMRRGALCSAATDMGYNKLALAHHSDDVLETMLLSFFYEGRLSTFAPKSLMTRTGVSVIRPFIYVPEKEITAFVRKADLPVLHNPCPQDKSGKRQYMKELIKTICKDIPFAKDRMISAIEHPERYNLWTKPD